jgi:hypothetical protein
MTEEVYNEWEDEPEECPECKASKCFVIQNGFRACTECGWVDGCFTPITLTPPYESKKPHSKGVSVGGVKFIDHNFEEGEEELVSFGNLASKGTESKTRYKPIFHWNERIAQLCMTDPAIPETHLVEIKEEIDTGEYGETEDISRATVSTILHNLTLDKYRERWKTLVHHFNPSTQMLVPMPEFLNHVEIIYQAMETQFFYLKHTMPQSLIRKRMGQSLVSHHQCRHNIIPFNYLFRKIMEAFDIWDFHFELPLLRSTAKLHHLDDITEMITKSTGLKFSRTPVIKRPKIKKK